MSKVNAPASEDGEDSGDETSSATSKEITEDKFKMPSKEDMENAQNIATSLRSSQGGSDIESGDKSASL